MGFTGEHPDDREGGRVESDAGSPRTTGGEDRRRVLPYKSQVAGWSWRADWSIREAALAANFLINFTKLGKVGVGVDVLALNVEHSAFEVYRESESRGTY